MFEQLIANSSNAQSLDNFISSNQLLIDEFVNSKIEDQRRQDNLYHAQGRFDIYPRKGLQKTVSYRQQYSVERGFDDT